MKIRIIHDKRSDEDEIANHAKRLITEQEKYMWSYQPMHVRPKGISFKDAITAKRCAECGGTYWNNDPYAKHSGCPGRPDKRELGFGA